MHDFLNSPTWDERKHLLEARSDLLLSDAADSVLSDLLIWSADDEAAVRYLEDLRDLLLLARHDGIDAALADRIHPSFGELQAIFDELNRPARPDDVPHRIELCERALRLVTRDTHPQMWASLHVGLAVSLSTDPLGDRAENIEQAIRLFRLALKVLTREALPEPWAGANDNLGKAYRNRIQGDRSKNIEKAIRHFETALEVFTPEAFPEKWASVANDLGEAFRERNR